jgi:hypothetical protein
MLMTTKLNPAPLPISARMKRNSETFRLRGRH